MAPPCVFVGVEQDLMRQLVRVICVFEYDESDIQTSAEEVDSSSEMDVMLESVNSMVHSPVGMMMGCLFPTASPSRTKRVHVREPEESERRA